LADEVTLKKGGELKEWQVSRIQDLVKKNSLRITCRSGSRSRSNKSVKESNRLNSLQQFETTIKKVLIPISCRKPDRFST